MYYKATYAAGARMVSPQPLSTSGSLTNIVVVVILIVISVDRCERFYRYLYHRHSGRTYNEDLLRLRVDAATYRVRGLTR